MRISYIILFCLPFLFSCEMKKDLLGGGKDSEDEKPSYENIGLLNLELKPEKEAVVPGTKGDEESGEIELNPEDFTVAILDSTGLTVAEYESYAEMKNDGHLLLPAGKYSIIASYGDNPNAGFNTPYYTGDTSCVVSEKEVVNLVAKCRLGNKKVQVVCTDDFLSQFNEDYSIVIDNGEGALKLGKDEKRIPYLKNTGILRFTMYATTHDEVAHTFSHDLSKDDLVNSHNNVLISLGTVPNVPDGDDNNNKPDDSEEPEEPDDPEPDDPNNPDNTEKPDVPVKSPIIKVDVSLVEKDYVIEIPSDFVESDKPDTPGGDDNNQGGSDDDNQGGSDTNTKPTIIGDGINISNSIRIPLSKPEKNIKVNINTPGKLKSLQVDISQSLWPALDMAEIDHSFDMCNLSTSLQSKLEGVGLKIPNKGAVKNVFDITDFVPLIAIVGKGTYTFSITVTDESGGNASAKLVIEMY